MNLGLRNRIRSGGNIISKLVGVIGGMGPEAALHFCKKLLDNTSAKTDQDHIRHILLNDPTVPDRTAAILSGDTAPVSAKLIQMAQFLETAGADFLVMPCNTAHFWADDIEAAIAIPLMHMIRETLTYMATELNAAKIGLISTLGTIKGDIYQNEAAALSLQIIVPNDSQKDVIMSVINEVKAGTYGEAEVKATLGVIRTLERQGADSFVLGCTELPLVVAPSSEDRLIDPMDVLARCAVGQALG